MKYTLSQLLKDKKLRIALTKGAMTFADGNGVFALDFATQSLRGKCQRLVFDKLYALGGEALFENLLAEGNTNLTRDPNAMNAGMVSVAGAEGWYLKTNVGDPTALASILFGIAGWAERNSDFDGELVSICDEKEEPIDDAEPEAEENESEFADEEEENEMFEGWKDFVTNEDLGSGLPYGEYSQATKNGLHVFYDEEKKQFVEFPVQVNGEQTTVEGMLECEPIFINGAFADSSCTVDDIFGYKYRLEENGKWGFISAGFSQVLEPQFDGFQIVKGWDYGKELLAWTVGAFDLTLWYATYAKDAKGNRDWRLQPTVTRVGDEDDPIMVCYLTGGDVPKDGAYFERNCSQGPRDYLYISSFDAAGEGSGLYWRESECEGEPNRFWELSMEPGLLYVRPDDRDLKPFTVPVCLDSNNGDVFDLQIFRQAVKGLKGGVEVKAALHAPAYAGENGFYVVCREGYWAVAILRTGTDDALVDLLTPFAFTAIDAKNAWHNQVVVDLFGKKGVYDYRARSYVIPCEYEKIQYRDCSGEPGYIVEKAGFEGKIAVDGSWETMLHR